MLASMDSSGEPVLAAEGTVTSLDVLSTCSAIRPDMRVRLYP